MVGYPLQFNISHHLIDEHTPDHQEMTLHHLVHLAIGTSYIFTNIQPYGQIILFLHDFSDIFINLSKFLHMSGHSVKCTGVSLTFTILFWVIQRIFLMIVGPIWTLSSHKY